MSNAFTIGRAGTNEADVQVGDAWSKRFNGQNDMALEQFRKLVEKYSDHIDARYGLALCLRTAGQKEAAIAVFNETKALAFAEADKQPEEPYRYQMIARMCEQQINTLQK